MRSLIRCLNELAPFGTVDRGDPGDEDFVAVSRFGGDSAQALNIPAVPPLISSAVGPRYDSTSSPVRRRLVLSIAVLVPGYVDHPTSR